MATCNTTCTSDSDCFSATCVNGTCGLTPVGAKCTSGAQCPTGFCADGQCCNTPCQGPCISCAISGHEGTCSPVGAGGIDPHGICVDQGAASCGTNGRCADAGTCAAYPIGTVCSPASCSGYLLTKTGQCGGLQKCVVATATCEPYLCSFDGSLCRSDCLAGDVQCAPGYYCGGDALCVAKKPSGVPCGRSAECASNDCATVAGALPTCQPF
jgi:hypothetical protein